MNYLEEIDSFFGKADPFQNKTLFDSSVEKHAEPSAAEVLIQPSVSVLLASYTGKSEIPAIQVTSWMDYLTNVLRLSSEKAIGIGLAAYYRDGGHAVPYRFPHMVIPPDYLPTAYRDAHRIRFGLIKGKYPECTTCVIGDGAERYWMPTQHAVDLLRKLGPGKAELTRIPASAAARFPTSNL